MSAIAPYDDSRFAPDHQIAQLRVPPHSLEGETSVLGALMLENSAWDRVGDLLTDTDFYRAEHKLIFSAIGALINATKPADVISVYMHLEAQGKAADVGGLQYLNSLAQYVPSAANIRRYAEIVRERSILRKLVAASEQIATNAFNTQGKDVAAVLDHASGLLMSLLETGRTGEEWVSTDKVIVSLLDAINERASGNVDSLPTGLADLDEKLDGGMRAGQLIIIGARPSMGKSALAVSIGMNVARTGKAVGMISLEMPAEELASRQLSMLSHVHLSKIRRSERLNDNDWAQVTRGIEELRQTPFHISEQSGININQLRARTRKLHRQVGLKLLIVDYVGLMGQTNAKDNRNTALGEATRGMKNLAKELRIPIICLAQLGREVEKRTGQRPILSDLRDSGEIEQDADIVIFIDRPAMRDQSLGDTWQRYAEAIVAKQRNGSLGSVPLRYVGENVTFLDWGSDPVPKKGSFGGGAL